MLHCALSTRHCQHRNPPKSDFLKREGIQSSCPAGIGVRFPEAFTDGILKAIEFVCKRDGP